MTHHPGQAAGQEPDEIRAVLGVGVRVMIEKIFGILVDEELDGGFGEDLDDVEAVTDEEVPEAPGVISGRIEASLAAGMLVVYQLQ